MFITFEGIEGCGKTTQIRRISKRLSDHGIPFVSTLEPGGTRTGKGIRSMLLDSRNNSLYPITELLLYVADRAQHVEEIIRPALESGKWVICDRFFDATIAYQGFARRQDMELINILNRTASQGIRPDMTFLLDCPPEIGLERALKRNKILSQERQDRFEKEKMDFHRDVRSAYLEIAGNEKERISVIDASPPEDEVNRRIMKVLDPFLADWKG